MYAIGMSRHFLRLTEFAQKNDWAKRRKAAYRMKNNITLHTSSFGFLFA